MPDGSKKVSSHCSLWDHDNATLSHVLCYCPYILNDGVFNRPKWRHDQVISLPLINSTLRPDILLINSKEVLIAELTCPMESSLNSRHMKRPLSTNNWLHCTMANLLMCPLTLLKSVQEVW
ncbi:hypothetical protein RCL1_008998 [Eukaryota sp. TZLM3-RCL]